jgi:hypothetical protein
MLSTHLPDLETLLPETRSRRRVLAIALTISLCAAAVFLMTIAVDSKHPPILNITREQYDAALVRWNSRHVTQYEEVVDYMGKARIAVEVDGTFEHVLSLESLDGTNFVHASPQAFDNVTIGALFARVRDALTTGQAEADQTWQEYGWSPHYVIRFDTELGYPDSIDVEPRVKRDAGNISIDAISLHIKVESIKIIK